MKKILLTSFIVALGLLGASCKDDNSTAGGGGEILPDQQVSCEILCQLMAQPLLCQTN